jgi:hypothetical protein
VREHRFSTAAQLVKIEQAEEALRRRKQRIQENIERHLTESPERMSTRLRRYNNRQALRDVRYTLTGKSGRDAKKSTIYLRAFDFIYDQWRKSGKSRFEGVRLSSDRIAQHLGVSKRQALRIVDALENRVPHDGDVGCPRSVDAGGLQWPGTRRTTSPGIILRIPERGKHSRFVVSLPEADSYREHLEEAMRIDFEREHAAEILAGITFENGPL